MTGDPGRSGQGAARGRGDVRRRRRALRPDQRRALARPDPALAPRGRAGGRRPAGRAGARPRGRHRLVVAAVRARPARTSSPADFSLGMLRVGKRAHPRRSTFVAGDALRLPFADGAFDAVTISFGLRNVADADAALRRDGPGDPAGRPAGRLRVQPPDLAPFRTVYSGYLMRGAAGGRPAGVQQPGRLRLPRRVDPGLAGPGRRWPRGSPPPAGPTSLAQPHRRHRRPAPRAPALTGVSTASSAGKGLGRQVISRRATNGGPRWVHDDKTKNKVEEIARRGQGEDRRRDRRRGAARARARRTRARPTSSRPARRSRTPSRTEHARSVRKCALPRGPSTGRAPRHGRPYGDAVD